MLSVEKPFKIRVNDDYIICDGYTFRDLRMDLLTGQIFIVVDFYREKQTIFTREYRVGVLVGDGDGEGGIRTIEGTSPPY